MPKLSRKAKRGVTGWMEVTLPDVPADFLFQELRNVHGFPAAIDSVVCFERYDPSSGKKKESLKEEVMQHNFAPSAPSAEPEVAEAGHCFFQKREFQGSMILIETQFTRVDDDYDADNKRTMTTACTSLNSTITSTYVVEHLGPTTPLQAEQPVFYSKVMSCSSVAETATSNRSVSSNSVSIGSSNCNIAGGCRWTFSYAMLPNNWRGKLLFWRQRKQLERDIADLCRDEFKSLQAAARVRYQKQLHTHQQRQEQSSSPKFGFHDAGKSALLLQG